MRLLPGTPDAIGGDCGGSSLIGGILMIAVTRLNGSKFYLNALLIETVEQTPDTVITTTTGKKYIVTENSSDVIRSIRHYLRSIGIMAAISGPQDTPSEGASS